MSVRGLIPALACLALGFFMLALPAHAAAKKGDVLEGTAFAIDGDTIEVEGVRVRLSGLDAPEMKTCEGRYARIAMDTLLQEVPITCVLEGRKSYKREVGTCSNAAGNLTQQMIATGNGIEYRTYSNQYQENEANAARLKRGPIWNPHYCRLPKP